MKILQVNHFNAARLKQLKPCKFNRPVRPERVKKILTNMMVNGYDQTEIITVDKKTNSAPDGQNRIAAFLEYIKTVKNGSKLTVPVQLVEFENDEEMKDWILRKNNLRTVWCQTDYIAVHRKTNDAYEICEKLAEVNKEYFYRRLGGNNRKDFIIDPVTKKPAVKYSAITSIMFGKPCSDKVRNNTLKVSDEDISAFYENYEGLENIIKTIGWTTDSVARRRYDMFAQAYIRFMRNSGMTQEQIIKTLKSRKKLREELYLMQFTTADGFNAWFGKIFEAYRMRKTK